MNHKVVNVRQLYEDSCSLYDDVVCGKADTIIDDLGKAITTLKNTWEGKDAGVQINNVVDVYNAMAKIRNALSSLSRDASFVASKYREIQNANRAGLEELAPLTVSGERGPKEAYSDNRDTINITGEALEGKTLLDTVNAMYEEFKLAVVNHYDAIMDNWQEGTGRDNAQAAFDEFIDSSNKYKSVLEDVSQSIAEALRNYQF